MTKCLNCLKESHQLYCSVKCCYKYIYKFVSCQDCNKIINQGELLCKKCFYKRLYGEMR
jgi:hypothetical protein